MNEITYSASVCEQPTNRLNAEPFSAFCVFSYFPLRVALILFFISMFYSVHYGNSSHWLANQLCNHNTRLSLRSNSRFHRIPLKWTSASTCSACFHCVSAWQVSILICHRQNYKEKKNLLNLLFSTINLQNETNLLINKYFCSGIFAMKKLSLNVRVEIYSLKSKISRKCHLASFEL